MSASTVSDEQRTVTESMSFELPQSSNEPRRSMKIQVCCHCCAGMVVGAALSTFAMFAVVFAAPSMPVPSALSTQLGLLLGTSLITGIFCCCITSFNPRRASKLQTRQSAFAFVLILLMAAILLAVPFVTQHRVVGLYFEAYSILVGLVGGVPPNPLPAGYCNEKAEGASLLQSTSATGLPPSDIADALVSHMTSEERGRLVQGIGWMGFQQAPGFYMGNILGVPRLGIPPIHMHDAGQGFRTTHRPMIGTVTSFPCSLAAAATWDAGLVRRMAAAIGSEFKRKGSNVLLGPGVDVARVPKNGRTAESLAGESPALGAVLGAAYVKGLQLAGVAAVAKHFSVYVQETNRALEGNGAMPAYSTEVSERVLFEVYYWPVIAMIRAGLRGVMCSYNRVNGTGACENSALLTRDLRGRLGFDGFVLSDWWAVSTAGVRPAAAGLDQNMPGNDRIFDALYLEAAGHNVSAMAARVLRGMLSAGPAPLGAFTPPPPPSELAADTGSTAECRAGCDCESQMLHTNATSSTHTALAREVAAAGAVLLKNTDRLLPLQSRASSLAAPLRVALVGAACNATHDIEAMLEWYAIGDYYVVGGSGRVLSTAPTSLLDALRARSHGRDSPPLSSLSLVLSLTDSVSAGVAAMAKADVAIACAGATARESSDRSSLTLDQAALLEGLAAAVSNTPLVVVAYAPGPFLTAPWDAATSAILCLFLSGQETGHAAADVLFGDVNPSGRLPLTLPLNDDDGVPICTTTECSFSEGLNVGWRGMHTVPVAYPFGHGLSFTDFNYSWVGTPAVTLTAAVATAEGDDDAVAVALSVAVANVGAAAGREVLQVYLSFPTNVGEPPLVLRTFARTAVLTPGASPEVVSLSLSHRDCSTWVPGTGWVLTRGEFDVVVGASSRDERLRAKFTL